MSAPRGFDSQRRLMVAAIRDRLNSLPPVLPPGAVERALMAMMQVPREHFICPWIADLAYLPMAIDIGLEQTISHPEMVTVLAACADPDGGRVLDVGTGSGYQAAVLSVMAEHVTSVEIIAPHAQRARQRISGHGYRNVSVLQGDATELASTFPREHFDAIVIAAKAERPAANLLALLKDGGRLVMPVESADGGQNLVLFRKEISGQLEETVICPARFVPLTGTGATAGPP